MHRTDRGYGVFLDIPVVEYEFAADFAAYLAGGAARHVFTFEGAPGPAAR
jgi:hypothetical protein